MSATRVRVRDESAGARGLAECLRDNDATICREWRRRIVEDPARTEPLMRLELQDHVPELVDRIIAELEDLARWRDDADAKGGLATRATPAMPHAPLQAGEGCNLFQILRELHHLREAIMDACEKAHAPLVGERALIVHAALDAAMTATALGCTQRAWLKPGA